MSSFMETYSKLSKCGFVPADHGVREKFVCSEKQSKYTLSLDPKMEGWRYSVDGYLITEGRKCDALILVKDRDDGFAEVFVELKGRNNVDHAISQLEETLKHELFKDNSFLLRWARISSYSYPQSQLLDKTVDKKTKEFIKQFHCDLRISDADTLTHAMFEAKRNLRTPKLDVFSINDYLYSGDSSKINKAISILYQRLDASQSPSGVVDVASILQILSLLNGSDGDIVPGALRYIVLCIEKDREVFVDDNMISGLNNLLNKYMGKFNGTELALSEEIGDRTEDVKHALLEIYSFLDETELFEGDKGFWNQVKS